MKTHNQPFKSYNLKKYNQTDLAFLKVAYRESKISLCELWLYSWRKEEKLIEEIIKCKSIIQAHEETLKIQRECIEASATIFKLINENPELSKRYPTYSALRVVR